VDSLGRQLVVSGANSSKDIDIGSGQPKNQPTHRKKPDLNVVFTYCFRKVYRRCLLFIVVLFDVSTASRYSVGPILADGSRGGGGRGRGREGGRKSKLGLTFPGKYEPFHSVLLETKFNSFGHPNIKS
jgi:hypothetical protein